MTDGVWVIGGYALINCIVVEAPEGLIVYDTGDNAETGKLFRELIETKISRKPIKAFIYSHSHYPLGTGAMVDDPGSVEVIGHPEVNATVATNLRGGGAPSAIPELGPVLTARAAVQFNNFLPATGPDAGIMPGLTVKRFAYLPVTRAVKDGETLKVAGLELQFFTKHISDDHSVTVWIPSKKAALNNFFWPGTPNLYTLRGSVYREPTEWRDGLKVIRDLQPEHLVNTHARAISGKEKVFEILTNYMDLITLTYDQTLRGILRGLGPDDLRYFVYKPKHLAEPSYNAETYGETPWFPPATFQFQMGWFDRDATTIFKLPPRDEAERLVALMRRQGQSGRAGPPGAGEEGVRLGRPARRLRVPPRPGRPRGAPDQGRCAAEAGATGLRVHREGVPAQRGPAPRGTGPDPAAHPAAA